MWLAEIQTATVLPSKVTGEGTVISIFMTQYNVYGGFEEYLLSASEV